MGLSPYAAGLRERAGPDLILMPSVSAVVVNDAGELLLGRRSDTGSWALVGGILEPDEQPADALVREVYEETAVHVVPERITGVYLSPRLTYANGDQTQYVATVFLCRAIGGEPRVNDDESLDVAYFPREGLPSLPTGHTQRINDALSGREAAAFHLSD